MHALLTKILSLALFGLVFYAIAAFAEWQVHPADWSAYVRGGAASLTLGAWLLDSLTNA